MGTCLLALSQLSTLLFGTHCLGNSATHNGLGLRTSINNQDNSSQTCPRSQYDTHISFLKFSSQVALGCVRLMLKPSGDPCYQREIAEWIESENSDCHHLVCWDISCHAPDISNSQDCPPGL